MTFDISGIIEDLKKGAVDAAKEVASEMLKEASADAIAFVEVAAPSIARYIGLRISFQITQEEFESLMKGLLALAEMNALTIAGLSEIQVQNTKNTILKAVTSIALGAISKLTI